MQRSLREYMRARFRGSRLLCLIMAIYGAFCVASMIYFAVLGMVRDALLAAFFLVVIPLVPIVEYVLKLRLGTILIAMIMFLAMGSTLGASYDLYTKVPFFDDILHTMSGFAFACCGFGLARLFVGEVDKRRPFVGCLLMGLFFSLAIATLWELFEYAGTYFLHQDMQEDTVVRSFESFYLSGTHRHAMSVSDIVCTVIYRADGSTVTIDGYLDLGLIDTVTDMAVCLLGSVVYAVALPIDRACKGRMFRAVIPQPFADSVVAEPAIDEPADTGTGTGEPDDVEQLAACADGTD